MSTQEVNDFLKYETMEDYLLNQPASFFPGVNCDDGEKGYPQKYLDIKEALIPIHNNVEKGAMLQSIIDQRKELREKIEELTEVYSHDDTEKLMHFKELLKMEQIIYLNKHGAGHVKKVIQKVFELVCNFRSGILTPSETFLLLCAIQVHDIGNLFGRKDHEKSAQQELDNKIKSFVPDATTRKLFFKIAQVHSGQIQKSRDTISKLRVNGTLFNNTIRKQLLAALLRFGDELADDSSRADLVALDFGTLPQESIIYHEYSKSLHTVKIEKNEISQTLYLSLEYYIDSGMITKTFLKDDAQKLLIDEIFARTIRIEQERRYCMRFLSQHLPLTEIRVRIEINPTIDVSDSDIIVFSSGKNGLSLMDSEVIEYTLKENGYPSDEIAIDYSDNTGEKVIAMLKGKGWRLP